MKRDRAALSEGRLGSPEFLRRICSRVGGAGQTQGRWSLVRQGITEPPNVMQWSANIARQLLARYGLVMRETAIAENVAGGYQTIYPALKAGNASNNA